MGEIDPLACNDMSVSEDRPACIMLKESPPPTAYTVTIIVVMGCLGGEVYVVIIIVIVALVRHFAVYNNILLTCEFIEAHDALINGIYHDKIRSRRLCT